MIRPLLIAAAFVAATPAHAQGLEARAEAPADGAVLVERVNHDGRAAVRVRTRDAAIGGGGIVPLAVAGFGNGVIRGWIAGRPLAGAGEGARGFVGIAFRVRTDERYEAFYIRPTNGRADDQLRRNHATQYVAQPEYPWERLRSETPGVYESYADMVPGRWLPFRIEIDGVRARLFLGAADQPALIVNDLKHGAGARGGVALWIGPAAEGYFSAIEVERRD